MRILTLFTFLAILGVCSAGFTGFFKKEVPNFFKGLHKEAKEKTTKAVHDVGENIKKGGEALKEQFGKVNNEISKISKTLNQIGKKPSHAAKPQAPKLPHQNSPQKSNVPKDPIPETKIVPEKQEENIFTEKTEILTEKVTEKYEKITEKYEKITEKSEISNREPESFAENSESQEKSSQKQEIYLEIKNKIEGNLKFHEFNENVEIKNSGKLYVEQTLNEKQNYLKSSD